MTRIEKHPAVLIVGAGPTGLTLACELARRGIPLRLIDAASGPSPASRGKGVQPRSLEVFDDLGIVEQIVAGGRFHVAHRFYDRVGGYQDNDLHEGREPQPDRPYASPLMIAQWRTESILHERLATLGVYAEFGTALSVLAQDEDGVTATLEHAGDPIETLRVQWLVGCDGGHSFTRKALGVSFLGETIESHRMLIADVKATGLDRTHWHAWRDDAGFVSLAPLPGTERYQLQAAIVGEQDIEVSLAAFQQVVDTRTGRSDIRLSEPSWMSQWRANVRMVDRYRVGRAFLAGDAAHIHSPAGGQGMNTGIQDAYNLGWKLAAVINGADDALLDTYEEERLPIAAWLLGVSSELHARLYETHTFGGQRDEKMLQLGLNYRSGRLALDVRQHPGTLRAGDRVPDAPGLQDSAGVRRLFDVLRGTHFTLLAFGEGWREVIDAVGARFGASVKCVVIGDGSPGAAADYLTDSQGYAVRHLDITRDTLLVARPDGYVGFITETAEVEPVLNWLSSVDRSNTQGV